MDLLNQSSVKGFLEKLHAKDRIPNALLFYGPPGVGKTLTALNFGKGILCLKKEAWGCGECLSCKEFERIKEKVLSGDWEGLSRYEEKDGRKVFLYLSGEHPDFIFVPPLGSSIKIDQVRAVKEFAYIKPALSHRKLIIIDEAQTMTRESANALLKVLEEPPHDTHFILTAQGKEQLLQTILSRTQQVEFKPLEEEAFYKLLGEENKDLYESSAGSYTLALKLKEKKEVIQLVDKFLTLDPAKVYEVSQKIDKLAEEDKELFLDLLERHLEETFLKKGLNYDKFEMVLGRLGELRSGLGRGLKFSLGILSLYALWR